jgi:hypothetical protein
MLSFDEPANSLFGIQVIELAASLWLAQSLAFQVVPQLCPPIVGCEIVCHQAEQVRALPEVFRAGCISWHRLVSAIENDLEWELQLTSSTQLLTDLTG